MTSPQANGLSSSRMPRQTRFPVTGPLDLRRTVRGTAQWGASTWLRTDHTGAWYAERTEEGPATVRLVLDGPTLTATAWGPGADRLLERTPAIAGLEDEEAPVVVAHHPVVEQALRHARGLRIGRLDRILPTLVGAIVGQKVTGLESQRSLRRLARRYGQRAPGPRDDLWLLPSARTLRGLPYAAYHPLGIDRRRAMVVIEVARRANRIEQLVGQPSTEIDRKLQTLRGIGPWTTGVVIHEALGDPDALPIGDYHLPNVIAYNLAGEPRADDARMLQLLEPYRGQRGRVVRLLKLFGSTPPKWGPRSEARDISSF
ncbi:MAG: DNA-3-methyladenine glycosylase 2 family protein [Myxococcota bacterium]